MQRNLKEELVAWKGGKNRLPLLVRGARQVGKSYLIENFGKEHFGSCVSINFEQNPKFARAFSTLEPKSILNRLKAVAQEDIVPGKTLLFFDEIQACPEAIMALRYFKEQMPELHVIGAGSLLEFALENASFRMPVGRVQYLYLKPLSFYEYLSAAGLEGVREMLGEVDLQNPPDHMMHDLLLEKVHEYAVLGGMPAVVQHYLDTQDFKGCQRLQTALLTTYRDDFGKYAKTSQFKYLDRLFEKAPDLIAQWFKYAKVDPHMQSRDIKHALSLLSKAGLLQLIFASAASGIPLASSKNDKKFKLLFLDTGLLQRSSQLDLKLLFENHPLLNSRGVLAEQFVGQELLGNQDPYEEPALYFWVREQRGSSAEVDYLVQFQDKIVPIEVKAGSTGHLRSLKLFMEEKNCPLGVRISQAPLSLEQDVLSLPFYMIPELERLLL